MSRSQLAISKICRRISEQVEKDGVINAPSLLEFSTAFGLILDYLEDHTKGNELDPEVGAALLAIYAKTQSRSDFRSLFERLFEACLNDGKKLYGLANSACYASRSGKLNLEQDLTFLKNLYEEKFGEQYFDQLMSKLEERGLSFLVTDIL